MKVVRCAVFPSCCCITILREEKRNHWHRDPQKTLRVLLSRTALRITDIHHIVHSPHSTMDFPIAQMVKNLPAVQETCSAGFDPWVGKFLWRREWQSTPVFLPGEFHGQRSLAGYSPWGHEELDTTERLTYIPHSWLFDFKQQVIKT